MAKKVNTNKKILKKTKQEKKNQTFIFAMAMVVIVTMLISGLYYLGSDTGSGTYTQPEEETYAFNAYGINQVASNASISVTADQTTLEYVAIPEAQCISMQSIGWVYNMSIPGLRSVMLDAVNYGKDASGNVCGTFLFFKLSFNSVDENTVSAINSELVNRLGDYTLKRSYVGILPVNLSGPGTDRVYVVGSADIAKGDIAEILLFQKTSDGTVFALERSRIVEGPTVPATISVLTDIMVQGAVTGDYLLDNIKKRINVTNSRLTPASFSVNATLDNDTIGVLSALAGVSVEKTENQTIISYNASMEKAEEILKDKNLTYARQDGSVILQVPLNTSVSAIEQAAKSGGVTSLKIKKIGLLKVPPLVRINGQTVSVENSDNFNAVLNLDTSVGDKVNITLSTMQFGDQVFVLGGSQAD